MQKIKSISELRLEIENLEVAQGLELKEVEFHYEEILKSITPSSVVKSALNVLTDSNDLKDNIVNSTIGLSAGYATKTMYETFSHSPVKKLVGTILMFGITNLVAKNPIIVSTLSTGIFNLIKNFTSKKHIKTEQAEIKTNNIGA
jgi:hypothetical protein